ncbi:TPA: EAL domain-containing protein [Yersinia enterocolitica]|nr:EAL domain-containing protein [Yersinia enterocolitica]
MKELLITQPDFMETFSCVGTDCREHCCKGQSVTLDRNRYQKYIKSPYADIKRIAINQISVTELALLKEDFRQSLLTLVQQTLLPPQSLYWMIDESTLLQYPFAIGSFLAKLQQLGCKLIVKEFGHNLNDFELLAEHHIDYLKFNSELVAHIHLNQMDEVLISIINGTAQRANIATLAGPVELPPTLSKLIDIGVDLTDGTMIGRTEPLSEVLNSGYFAIK